MPAMKSRIQEDAHPLVEEVSQERPGAVTRVEEISARSVERR